MPKGRGGRGRGRAKQKTSSSSKPGRTDEQQNVEVASNSKCNGELTDERFVDASEKLAGEKERLNTGHSLDDKKQQDEKCEAVSASGNNAKSREKSQGINDVMTLGASCQSVKLRSGGEKTQLLRRPGFGRAGRRISLKANFLRMEIPVDGDIYHYDVTIMPSTCPRSVNHEIIKNMLGIDQKAFGREKPVFDGKKNLYSKDPLPIGNDMAEFKVQHKSDTTQKEREFKVQIKFAARVSLQLLNEGIKGRTAIPQDTIQALEVVLRMAPSARYVPVGRSFFSEPATGRAVDLGSGCEMWYGHYQSIRPTQWGMLVNIDQTTSAFYKTQPVLDFLKECIDGRLTDSLSDAQRVKFQKQIKGLKVQLTYIVGQKRQKRVLGISKETAANLMFDMETDGKKKKLSVAEYFAEKYNIKLSYPRFPCLKVGSEKNVVYIPMEVCTLVPGQRCVKKLSPGQTAKMIRETAKDAMNRKTKIEDKVKEAKYDEDRYLDNFNMKISTSLVSVEGRVIEPPPAIQYAEKRVNPREGKWDMRNAGFYEGLQLERWGLLICASVRYCNEDLVGNFCRQLSIQSSKLGMQLRESPSHVKYHDMTPNLLSSFQEILDKVGNIQLMIAILNGKYYEDVKTLGDIYHGVPTQCVLLKNVKKCNPQLLANLCLKINAKIGGMSSHFIQNGQINYRPEKVFGKPVIFLGADVTHPSPGDHRMPSIAAVVGSLDKYPMKYAAQVKAQGHRKEIIEDLKSMTKALLIEFRKATRVIPDKIIMYRDGVSEGQFSQVLQSELEAVRNACRELALDFRPAITFITVQKRHHVRLFAENERDQIGKSKNIPAGTVVDEGICHPTEFDFYLCSHSGIQGTSRPAHYRILWDDSKFTADELQQLTYALCHNFARCTRAVSIPPPAYYAHHVAMRARYHIQFNETSSQGSSSESQTGHPDIEAINKTFAEAIKVHDNLMSKMYFI